jgi:Na+/proline symporter
MAAGNIFGQIALFWHKVIPCNSRHGIVSGMIVGMALWIILFVPLATFGIQPRFINNIKPDFILISITLLENIKTTKRLIKEVRSRLKIPIIIGGPAVNGVNSYDTINVRVMQNASAKELVTLINNMY